MTCPPENRNLVPLLSTLPAICDLNCFQLVLLENIVHSNLIYVNFYTYVFIIVRYIVLVCYLPIKVYNQLKKNK